ncbi:hypothetical protein D1872_279090 [compost metagenome]
MELLKNPAIVAFHRIQCQEKLLGDFPIGESLRDELQYFDFALAKRLDPIALHSELDDAAHSLQPHLSFLNSRVRQIFSKP